MKNHRELYLQIGERIQSSREAAGLTQAQLAEAAEISTQFMSDVERGVSGPSIYTLICICRKLHVSSDYLLMGIESDKSMNEFEKRIKYLSDADQASITKGLKVLHDVFN